MTPRRDTPAAGPASSLASGPGGTRESTSPDVADLASLVVELQARGLRVEVPLERRQGGAGPSDSGMLWVGGIPLTVPTDNATAAGSPYVLKAEDDGYAVYRDGRRLAEASVQRRPRFYDLTTADGIPYWKIALLHLDSFASTVVQTCAYWGNDDQCRFCGIGVSLDAGRTIVRRARSSWPRWPVPPRELDGAVDATLTTGSSRRGRPGGAIRGPVRAGRQGRVRAAGRGAVRAADGPRRHRRGRRLGIDSVGIHVESFDPEVLQHVAPAKARTGIERYFATWERAVALFGEGQVSTYVILGMGEDPELTVQGCRRAVDMGVLPFVVPLRPVAGSLMQDVLPPDPQYTQRIYRKVASYMVDRGVSSASARAGCARCQACSGLSSVQRVLQVGRRPDLAAGAG